MPAEPLPDILAIAREVTIHTGLTGPAGVVIWVVVIDGAIMSVRFVAGGANGMPVRWPITARKSRLVARVAVGISAVTDAATIAAVSAAYRVKYFGSPYVEAMVADDTLATTLLLTPLS